MSAPRQPTVVIFDCETTGTDRTRDQIIELCIQRGLAEAERKGLIERDLARVWPTARGLDFLSDLQAIFLPES